MVKKSIVGLAAVALISGCATTALEKTRTSVTILSVKKPADIIPMLVAVCTKDGASVEVTSTGVVCSMPKSGNIASGMVYGGYASFKDQMRFAVLDHKDGSTTIVTRTLAIQRFPGAPEVIEPLAIPEQDAIKLEKASSR